MTTLYAAVVYDGFTLRQLNSGEALGSSSIALSAQSGNQVQALADGLYVGNSLPSAAYYVSSSGTDSPTSGSKSTPYQTLNYCLSQLSAASPGGVFSGQATVALACGGTYPMTADFQCKGQLTLTFFGDPNYGDFNGSLIGTPGTSPSVMYDLERPVITPGPNGTYGMYGVRLQSNFAGSSAHVILSGVQVNLPSGVSGAQSSLCDFVTSLGHTPSRLSLQGAIINVTDNTSQAGLLGIYARTALVTVDQFASQLWIEGVAINGTTDPQTLLSREFYFKFYPDFLGNSTSAGFLTSGSSGSGIMQLNWSNVTTQTVVGSKVNLSTFPVTGASGSYGVGQYFTNLTRDQQQRPLNVICSSLI